jgi:class 3 adenylate cyclase/CheY-like chemotaxis protein
VAVPTPFPGIAAWHDGCGWAILQVMADLHELTFLFTDIEGSTPLLRKLGDRYADVLGTTRTLLGDAVAAEGGRVVDTRADDLFAVFPCPKRAVRAAAAAQRAFAAHEWPEGIRVRVRMGVHTGLAAPDRGHDFLGLDVHRAARIASAGHGGQVLLSAGTAKQVDEETVDLGAYELDGIAEPEQVFQLMAQGLQTEFPPLRCGPRRDVNRLRVVLADDSVLIREGIARVLEDAGIHVAAQAGTAEELLRDVELTEPDVAIVDIRMPPSGTDEGLRAARTIRKQFPGVGVLLLSQALEPTYAAELVGDDPTGVGYLLKDRAGDVVEFTAAVKRVAEGGCALDPELAAPRV